ncbi:hypothetical protein JCM11251_004928 [Rhodosporidiobolus azoricus]
MPSGGLNTPSSKSPSMRKRSKPIHASPTSKPTSRSPLQVRKERWSTDEEVSGPEEESEEEVVEPSKRQPSSRSSKKKPPPSVTRRRSTSSPSPFAVLRTLSRPVLLITRLLSPLLAPAVPYVLLCVGLYLFIAIARSYLYSYLSSLALPSFLLTPLHTLSRIPLPLPHLHSLPRYISPVLSVPCSALGILCPAGHPSARNEFQLLSAGAARTAAVRAQHAVDIFDHLVKLADPEESVGLGLHPVEAWELATAVRYTSNLEDREIISEQLSELGDLTRVVKEHVIGLNAQGMNAMSWIIHEFTRLEELLTRASTTSHMSAKDEAAFTALLESLFTRISTSLTDLLTSLDRALPTATLASDSARRIFSALRASERSALDEWEDVPWTGKLLDAVGNQGNKARMLRRDLELTRASAGAVVGVWEALEGTREALLGYSKHVGHFKAGVVGFHLSGHGLSVADEVASLQTVMGEMRGVVEDARRSSGGGRARRGRVGEIGG